MKHYKFYLAFPLLFVAAGCGSGLKVTWEGAIDMGYGAGGPVRLECRSDGSVVVAGVKCNPASWSGDSFYLDRTMLDADFNAKPRSQSASEVDQIMAFACGPSLKTTVRWVDSDRFDIAIPAVPEKRTSNSLVEGHPAVTWSFTRALARQ
jgi:hypothetical protein